jgi:hypothetical protein
VPPTTFDFAVGTDGRAETETISDFASRYLLTCEALSTTQEKFAFTVFERTFKDVGLPREDEGEEQRRRCGVTGSRSPNPVA